MNPKAEELKKRTFTFGLQVIAFCRLLRNTWEGRELSDQLFRAGTRVGANYRPHVGLDRTQISSSRSVTSSRKRTSASTGWS
jgi:hypothetical protein